jgi:isochorismate hydrolase
MRDARNPWFAGDAMTSLSVDAHTFATREIFTRMGRVRSTDGVVKGLQEG